MPGYIREDMLCKYVDGSLPEMKTWKQELTCMDKFQLHNAMSKLDTTLTRDWQRKDKPVPQDQNKETVHFSDVAGQSILDSWHEIMISKSQLGKCPCMS